MWKKCVKNVKRKLKRKLQNRIKEPACFNNFSDFSKFYPDFIQIFHIFQIFQIFHFLKNSEKFKLYFSLDQSIHATAMKMRQSLFMV